VAGTVRVGVRTAAPGAAAARITPARFGVFDRFRPFDTLKLGWLCKIFLPRAQTRSGARARGKRDAQARLCLRKYARAKNLRLQKILISSEFFAVRRRVAHLPRARAQVSARVD
jgi:hypothetical protein